LIHVEQLWAEDKATAEGRLLHEQVDAGRGENRSGVRIARSIQVRSLALGVSGKADVVELRGDPPVPFPVEYKRGQPKAHRADEVQLCAQAICLEEAFGVAVPQGALFYGRTKRRTTVVFDSSLRALTARVAAEARDAIRHGVTPAAVRTPACRGCSLHAICRPERLGKPPTVGRWLALQIAAALEEPFPPGPVA
jgi:CRISPR-associated exonuclease Cas4